MVTSSVFKLCRFEDQKKCEIFAIFVFLPPLAQPPSPPLRREAVKQLCDS